MNKSVAWFVKFFEEEQHADQFMSGHLHLKVLSYFKALEDDDGGRQDKHEAVSHWLQPNQINITIQPLNGGSAFTIPSEDLAGPIAISLDIFDSMHVFCMYAVGNIGFEIVDGQLDLSLEDIDLANEQLKFDARCLEFGKWAVVVSAEIFMERLQSAMVEQNFKFMTGLVEYYDDKTFHGQFTLKQTPFRKQQRFDYQKEFRVCVFPREINMMTAGPMNLSIGDLSSGCTKMSADDVMTAFKLTTTSASR